MKTLRMSRRALGLAAFGALLMFPGLGGASLTVVHPGIIYTITTDGDLLWMRHDGRRDGSSRWAPKTGSKVGAGWTAPAFSGANGVIYTIAANGDLLWYRHDGRGDGTFEWASNAGRKVGNGWGGLQHVFSGGNGVIYAVAANGDLLWNRHDGRADGTSKWAASTGRKVGNGWGGMKRVFSGGDDGVIYAVRADGELLWYRHEGRGDGTFRWASNAGRSVGSGWASPRYVFGG